MLCPACEKEMLVLEFEHVELDYCCACGGVWLDSGELELIGQRAGVLEGEFLRALSSERGKKPTDGGRRPCPVCRKPMREVQTDTDPPVVVDRCARRHGLWFDRGELRAVVRAAGAEEANPLVRFFGELATDHPEPP